MQAEWPRCLSRRSRAGFTLVELVVACVVVATALLGVYSLFAQAMGVIGNSSISWANRGAARATMDYMCEAIEQTVNIEGTSTLIGSRTKEGRNALVCLVCAWQGETASGGGGVMEWHRYSWMDRAEGGEPIRLEFQRIPVAGSRRLVQAGEQEGPPEEAEWMGVEPVVIASGVEHLSLRYRGLGQENTDWQNTWDGRAGTVAVRVAVKCGDEHVECVTIPRAVGSLVPSRGGQ